MGMFALPSVVVGNTQLRGIGEYAHVDLHSDASQCTNLSSTLRGLSSRSRGEVAPSRPSPPTCTRYGCARDAPFLRWQARKLHAVSPEILHAVVLDLDGRKFVHVRSERVLTPCAEELDVVDHRRRGPEVIIGRLDQSRRRPPPPPTTNTPQRSQRPQR